MSHIVKVEIEVKDPDAIRAACKDLGYELSSNDRARGYNNSTFEADYVMRLPGPYDVGFVKAGDGYDLKCDLYQGHVENALGKNLNRFRQAYATQKTLIEARRKGYSARQVTQDDGSVQIRISV